MLFWQPKKRGGESALNTARLIEQEFGDKFFKFMITRHPADIPGEIAGKGSNDSWAIREAKDKIIDGLKIPYERIIVSVFDVDTAAPPGVFWLPQSLLFDVGVSASLVISANSYFYQ